MFRITCSFIQMFCGAHLDQMTQDRCICGVDRCICPRAAGAGSGVIWGRLGELGLFALLLCLVAYFMNLYDATMEARWRADPGSLSEKVGLITTCTLSWFHSPFGVYRFNPYR